MIQRTRRACSSAVHNGTSMRPARAPADDGRTPPPVSKGRPDIRCRLARHDQAADIEVTGASRREGRGITAGIECRCPASPRVEARGTETTSAACSPPRAPKRRRRSPTRRMFAVTTQLAHARCLFAVLAAVVAERSGVRDRTLARRMSAFTGISHRSSPRVRYVCHVGPSVLAYLSSVCTVGIPRAVPFGTGPATALRPDW